MDRVIEELGLGLQHLREENSRLQLEAETSRKEKSALVAQRDLLLSLVLAKCGNEDDDASNFNALTKGLDEMASLDAWGDDEEDRPKLVFNPPKNTISLADMISGPKEASTTDKTILSNVSSLALDHLPQPDVEERAVEDLTSQVDLWCSVVLDSLNDSAPGNTTALTTQTDGVRKEYMKEVLQVVLELLAEVFEQLEQLAKNCLNLLVERARMVRKIDGQRRRLRNLEDSHGTE